MKSAIKFADRLGRPPQPLKVPSCMDLQRYRYLLLSDLYRINGRADIASLIKAVLLGLDTYQYNFWMRTCAYLCEPVQYRYTIYPIAKFMLRRMSFRFGISISPITLIDSGFFIGHFSGIIISPHAIIGKNCNISQGVTLGVTNRGERAGAPTIGDNVYIGPGAKIIGKINIGDNVAIGANSVVTKSMPDNSVVVGVPGKVVSEKGANGYIDNTDYDQAIGIA